MKHTPGPWECLEVRTSCGRAFRIGAGEMIDGKGKGGCIIYDDYPGNPDNERQANARLIAAAPEMFEALDAIVMKLMPAAHTNNLNADFKPLYEQAKAVLSIARGETA